MSDKPSRVAEDRRRRSSRTGLVARRAAVVGCAGTLAALAGGCSHWDSFLDPSVVGRWERTPTTVPILERIAAIEDEEAEYVEVGEVEPEDLIPEVEAYRVGPGDVLRVTVWDLVQRGVPEPLQRVVDPNGYIEIPQVGRVFVHRLSEEDVAARVMSRIAEADLIDDPLVSVVVEQRRKQTFHLMGNVRDPGPYFIPASDYRLLQALVSAGGFSESVPAVYVIRQVPLTPEAAGAMPERPDDGDDRERERRREREEEDLLRIIEELSDASSASPGGHGTGTSGSLRPVAQDRGDPEPLIDLIEPDRNGRERPRAEPAPAAAEPGRGRWVFIDGRWTQMVIAEPTPVRPARNGDRERERLERAAALMTQRVIRVPTRPLLAGDARYNIVVRPGDIVRVPPPLAGNVYIDGQVVRPGVYTLPPVGRLTLTRAMTSAGGLGGLAIPERVDLTRVVGNNQQATIMLNLRAIESGTQPDVYLKPDDRINVGTNFWAVPLAVLRGGLRINYGFGFLLDRNFGNDVFGAPPVNRGGGQGGGQFFF